MVGLSRRLIAAGLVAAITGAALVAPASAQETERVLEIGTPVSASLNQSAFIQVFTLEAEADTVVTVTTSNELGVPLAVVVTDASGETIAQGTDDDIDGEFVLAGIELPEAGTYYLNVFKASGVASVANVTFTLVVDSGALADEPTAAATAAATEAEATPEPTAVPTTAPDATPDVTDAPAADTTAEADAPGQVVTTAGLQVTLSWETTDDLDLEVRDPIGGSLYFTTPTVPSGGSISQNINQGCAVPTAPASESATWSPGGIPTGSYEVLVYFQQSCNNDAPAAFTAAPVVDGTALTPVQATLQPGQVYVFGFTVNADGTASLNTTGSVVNEAQLPAPASELRANAVPLVLGDVVEGVITNEQPYQSYALTLEQGQLVSAAAQATSGSLDTFVGIVDAAGNLVRFNDDFAAGSTDAQIQNWLTSASGEYILFVTRYGKVDGATEGNYVLTTGTSQITLPTEFGELPTGSLQVLLLWSGATDLQLLLRDPAGDAVFDDVPQIGSGGILAANGNVNCRAPIGSTPYSYIYYPETIQPRPGTYEVEVWFQNNCNDLGPVNFNLLIIYNGQEIFSTSATPILNERYLVNFDINVDGTAVMGPGGIIRGLQDLDYQPEVTTAPTIQPNAPVDGAINSQNRFDVYAFDGVAGDVVNIAMNSTSGSLDPTLYLVSPSGLLVASNDDAVAGENINSLIANFGLPEDGRYIIIATHYGGPYGGTAGTYRLTLTQLN
jgi:hypothetical protein